MDLLFILKTIVIAIIEGLTEFIPVSSTGHMIIASDLMTLPNDGFIKMFEVVIQLGAILAIVVLFWKKLTGLLISLIKKEKSGIQFSKAFIIGTIPALILGFLLESTIDKYLFNTWVVLAGLFIGAILLLVTENHYKNRATTFDVDQITWKQALKVGFFQCLAMWPGMSRSSSTIVGGWISGFSSVVAAEFSFFLAIPIMFGASLVKLVKFQLDTGLQTLTSTQALSFGLGFVIAFLVALICVKAFVSFLKRKPLKIFAYYRIAVSIVLAVILLIKS
ncbi:MAG: undecaprenyl-diphosphate phosphatase [Saccharofermentanales bacterium]